MKRTHTHTHRHTATRISEHIISINLRVNVYVIRVCSVCLWVLVIVRACLFHIFGRKYYHPKRVKYACKGCRINTHAHISLLKTFTIGLVCHGVRVRIPEEMPVPLTN